MKANRSKIWTGLFASLLAVSVLSGCGEGKAEVGGGASEGNSPQSAKTDNDAGNTAQTGGQAAAPATAQPVELTVLSRFPLDKEDLMVSYFNPVHKKYPNLTFKVLNNKDITIENAVAAKMNIDVILTAPGSFAKEIGLGLTFDLSDMIKQTRFDLNRIDPGSLDMVKKVAGGELSALPYANGVMALYYNKDIFDKFGVPYLKDGITWDEFYEVVKKLTREDGGVQYKGFMIAPPANVPMLNQYGYELIDPKTQLPTFDQDHWKPYFENLIRFFRIPGNEFITGATANRINAFVKDKTVATFISGGSDFPKKPGEWDFNWDIASFPTFDDRPGVGPAPLPPLQFPVATSKHRTEAFETIAEILSDSVQNQLAKGGILPALKTVNRSDFGADQPMLKGKNVKALIPTQYAEPITWSDVVQPVKAQLDPELVLMFTGKEDVNTGLRSLQEKSVRAIEAAK